MPASLTSWINVIPTPNQGVNTCCATPGAGYVVIYVDNQTIGKDVWFDNISIEHYTSNVIEENHYYPFGLTLTTTAAGAKEQPYKYNTKELEKSFGLETYEYGARQYDPQIGRWKGVDSLADHPNQVDKSPYSAFWNNPILYDDPDGQCPFCPWLDAVIDIGFVLYDAGVLIHEKVTTGKTSGANWAALGADGASILVPMSVGAGAAVRAGVKAVNKADNAVDVTKTVDKVRDVKQIGPAGDAGATVTNQIPSNWTKKTSKNGEGTVFKDPKNPSGNNVRVQGGNPKSPNPAQQKPYVKQTQNGKTVDVNGKQVDPKSMKAHIPKEDFKFKKK